MSPRFVPRGMKQMHTNRAVRRQKEKSKVDIEEFMKPRTMRYANQVSDRDIRGPNQEDAGKVFALAEKLIKHLSNLIEEQWPDADAGRPEPHMVAPAILGNAIAQMVTDPTNRAGEGVPLGLGSNISVQVILEILIRSGLIQFDVPGPEQFEVDVVTVPAGDNDGGIPNGPEQHAASDRAEPTSVGEGDEGELAGGTEGVRKTTLQ